MDPPPPIAQVLPLLSQASSIAFSSASLIVRTLARLLVALSYPLRALSPIPLILYALAPFIVFVRLIVDALVFTPFSIATSVVSALYPVYVFFGVTFIAAVLLGAAGRAIALALAAGLAESQQAEVPPVLQVKSGGEERTSGHRRRTLRAI
jgi:hypothetical protein